MTPIRPSSSPLAAVLGLGVGLVLGAGIGLPTAHWVAGVLTQLPAVAASPGTGAGHSPSPTAPPSNLAATASPAPATPVPTASPTPTACAPLVAGQQPLAPLRSPPSGYKVDPALDWVGCGAGTVPSASSFALPGPWLVALSYTCPGGTASGSAGPTLTVAASGSPGVAPVVVVQSRGDSAVVTGGDLSGAPLTAGTYRLSVTAAPACLWHLAVERS